MTLLNVNKEHSRKETKAPSLSRGTIIPSLLHCDTLASVLPHATALEPTRYGPFRLVLASRRHLAEVWSDGCHVRLTSPKQIAAPLLFTGLSPEVISLPPGSFAGWMHSCGKLGGQHKVPRMDNTGQLTEELTDWFRAEGAKPNLVQCARPRTGGSLGDREWRGAVPGSEAVIGGRP
jgi:hypothetical protein